MYHASSDLWYSHPYPNEDNRRKTEIFKDWVRNEEIHQNTEVNDIIELINEQKWRSAEHIARIVEGTWTKKLLQCRPRAEENKNKLDCNS